METSITIAESHDSFLAEGPFGQLNLLLFLTVFFASEIIPELLGAACAYVPAADVTIIIPVIKVVNKRFNFFLVRVIIFFNILHSR